MIAPYLTLGTLQGRRRIIISLKAWSGARHPRADAIAFLGQNEGCERLRPDVVFGADIFREVPGAPRPKDSFAKLR